MTFLSPNVGGHQQPLISGHSFAPSQKGHQQNCQVGICLNKKPRRNHTAPPGSAVWDPGFSEASFAQDFSGSFQALREQLRTLLTPLFARVVTGCYHIFVHSFFWHRLNIVLKYWILSTSQRNVPTPTKNLRMDLRFWDDEVPPWNLGSRLSLFGPTKIPGVVRCPQPWPMHVPISSGWGTSLADLRSCRIATLGAVQSSYERVGHWKAVLQILELMSQGQRWLVETFDWRINDNG